VAAIAGIGDDGALEEARPPLLLRQVKRGDAVIVAHVRIGRMRRRHQEVGETLGDRPVPGNRHVDGRRRALCRPPTQVSAAVDGEDLA
jgi:hypothetical protein